MKHEAKVGALSMAAVAVVSASFLFGQLSLAGDGRFGGETGVKKVAVAHSLWVREQATSRGTRDSRRAAVEGARIHGSGSGVWTSGNALSSCQAASIGRGECRKPVLCVRRRADRGPRWKSPTDPAG
jgi:hypothetical protein